MTRSQLFSFFVVPLGTNSTCALILPLSVSTFPLGLSPRTRFAQEYWRLCLLASGLMVVRLCPLVPVRIHIVVQAGESPDPCALLRIRLGAL